jgi:hypothetical protein
VTTALLSPNGRDRAHPPDDEVLDGQPHDPIAEAERAMRRRLDDHVHALRQELTAASNQRMDLERLLHVAKSNERRIARAVQALEGDDTQPKPTAAPARSSSSSSKPSKPNNWTLSEERISRVQTLLERYWREGHGPVSPTQFRTIVRERYDEPISTETCTRAFRALREREVIRKSGSLRGGGTLYAPMPVIDDEEGARAR